MADRILVFIPAYHCAPQIGRVLRQFANADAARFAEILVLDNRSTDDTAQAALAARGAVTRVPVTVARNRANYGLGGSHKAAFAYAARAGFSHVVTLHGDDQGSIADLLPILDAGRHRRAAACLGARFMAGSRCAGYSTLRIAGNHGFNALFSLATFRAVRDLGSGLNIVGPEIFAAPGVVRWSDDLRFNIYQLLDAIDRKLAIDYFPIGWREDDQVSNVKLFSQARRTLTLLATYTLARNRFRTADHRAVLHESYEFDLLG